MKYQILFSSGYQKVVEVPEGANPIKFIMSFQEAKWLASEECLFAINLKYVEGIFPVKDDK